MLKYGQHVWVESDRWVLRQVGDEYNVKKSSGAVLAVGKVASIKRTEDGHVTVEIVVTVGEGE